MSPSILVDDSQLTLNFNFLGNNWSRQNQKNGVYNQTVTVWNSGSHNAIQPPELTIFYYGADINFYGTMTNNLAANYTIDNGTVAPVPFPVGIASGRTGINLFGLLNLSNGLSHNINIFPVSGQFTLDYVTYLPNANTTLQGLDLILDNSDPGLQYSSGQWNHTTGDFKAGRPYNGTMSGTNIIGATMQVTFVGSDISVYGLLNQVDGRLSASFAVDNQAPVVYTPFDDEQEDTDPATWTLAKQFFHQNLAPGQHQLVVTLTDVSGPQMLWLDYVVYEGTASTNLALPSPSSGSGSENSPGGGNGNSNSNGGGNGNGSGLNSNNGKTFPKSAIAGILFAALISALLLAVYARRRLRKARYSSVMAISKAQPNIDAPHTPVAPPPPPPPPLSGAPPMAMAYQLGPPMDLHNINRHSNPYLEPPPVSLPNPHLYESQSSPLPPTPRTAAAAAAAHRAATWDAAAASPASDDTYYAYDEKRGSVALGWGVGAARSPSGTPRVPTPGFVPSHVADTNQNQQARILAPHVDAWTPPELWTHPASATAAHGKEMDWLNEARSSHGHGDVQDDEDAYGGIAETGTLPELRRERDAGPVRAAYTLPPAYDDRVYHEH